ncbi:hypothetical protein [Bradyrhizobium erythrophlei]|uniref:Uncharacterized protein n=1 Tax=Bradyrhizobium erythrophlei TaxID=1437360 RepID=A0A1M7UNV8_9BRAD|nr:hypothetical protein [Bradyrhizobium erythrophlei]SHN84692.1 hypothetical protein SAMN05444170_6017 [Bradyrhizobium erythrophlei]
MEGPKYIKPSKTTQELEAMILEDLRNVDGCPARGVNVTGYGIPWKALLMFGADAGRYATRPSCSSFSRLLPSGSKGFMTRLFRVLANGDRRRYVAALVDYVEFG